MFGTFSWYYFTTRVFQQLCYGSLFVFSSLPRSCKLLSVYSFFLAN